MTKKINLGATLAALFLFLLPWIDIQCSNKSMVTQSGIQAIYGGGSVSEEIEALGGKDGPSSSGDKDSLGYAPLIGIALLLVVLAVICAVVALRGSTMLPGNSTGILCAAALAVLAIQASIGFPAKKKMLESMGETGASQSGEEAMGASMASAMMMNIRVERLTPFYLELLMLGIPTLILCNGFVDKMKRG